MENKALEHFNNGKALLQVAKYKQALKEFKMAEKMGYTTWEVNCMVAQTYVYMTSSSDSGKDKLKNFKKARRYAHRAMKEAEDNNEVKYTYALCEYHLFNYDESMKYFKELENKNIHRGQVLFSLAHMYSKQRKLIPALKYINKAMKIECSQQTYINKLMLKAEIQYRMKDIDVSLKNFLEAHKLGDNNRSLCYIAQIYIEKNQYLNAQKYLKLVMMSKLSKEVFPRVNTLTYEELKQILIDFLNRFEFKEHEKKLDQEIFMSAQKKLYSKKED